MESAPPAGMNYNDFRKWRKENSIRGSSSELSEAWREYSAIPETREDPAPTKGYDIPPDQEEILNSLEDLPLPLGVGIVRSGLCFHESLTRGMLYVFADSPKGVTFSNVGNDMKPGVSKWSKPIRGFVDSFIKNIGKGVPLVVHPSPLALLEIYKLREQCTEGSEYLESVKKVVRDYYLEVSMTAIGVLIRDDDALLPIQDSISGQGSEYPPLIERGTLLTITPNQPNRMEILRQVIGRVAWIAQDLSVLSTLKPLLSRIDNSDDASVLIHIFVSLLAALSTGYGRI